ncbi:MAG TPA: pitrilysin family protein [Gemmatimonadales bacterium]|jgi:zinc protease
MNRSLLGAIVAALAVTTATSVVAQGTVRRTAPAAPVDRSIIPPPTAAPAFKVPAYTVDTLSNGARLVVVERRALPIVTVSIHFEAGTNALGASQASASFLSSMTREGTTDRTADQLANDLAILGTNIGIGVGTESGTAGFSTLVRDVPRAMDLMMDMMLHSTYPAAALERLRVQAISSYDRAQDNVVTVASQVGPGLVYGDQPYGHVVNADELKSVSREDVAHLAEQVFVPGNATVYVVGDMTRLQARAAMERAFKAWPEHGAKVDFQYPPAPALPATTVYVVDMPNKPQSYLYLTRAVAPAFGPEMAQIDMANYVLGGALQSRLSANIREAHGYSYGFNSRISWVKGPGPFVAAGSVTREKTDSALIEAMKEIRGMTGARPVTPEELQSAKNALTLSLPVRLQSDAGVLSVVSRVVDEKLPRNWWSDYIAKVNATTAGDVANTASQYLDPNHMVLLVVGDGAKILAPLKAAGLGPVVQLDKAGHRIP